MCIACIAFETYWKFLLLCFLLQIGRLMGYFRDESRWHTWIFVWSLSNILVQIYHMKTSHILVTSTNIVHWHILIWRELVKHWLEYQDDQDFFELYYVNCVGSDVTLSWLTSGLSGKANCFWSSPNIGMEEKAFSRSYLHIYVCHGVCWFALEKILHLEHQP